MSDDFILVNDASCLINLRKGGLLEAFFQLPCRFLVPLPVWEEELLFFSTYDWKILKNSSMQTYSLPPQLLQRSSVLRRRYRGLTVTDSHCITTAEVH